MMTMTMTMGIESLDLASGSGFDDMKREREKPALVIARVWDSMGWDGLGKK